MIGALSVLKTTDVLTDRPAGFLVKRGKVRKSWKKRSSNGLGQRVAPLVPAYAYNSQSHGSILHIGNKLLFFTRYVDGVW